jgi:clostripain
MICAVDLTKHLDENCSVDFLDLDLCYMGCVEFLYQIRKGNGGFSSHYVTASAPEVWGMGQNYSNIYKEFIPDITPEKLARLVLKLQDEYTQYSGDWHPLKSKQSFIACDLSKISNVKQKFDKFCNVLKDKKELAESVRASRGVTQDDITHYFSSNDPLYWRQNWKQCPYFDLYDFVFQIGEKDDELKEVASEVCEAIDELILDSFGRESYSRFQPGKMGLSFFYPDFSIYGCSWDYMIWNKVSSSENECYGNLSWSKDNADAGNWLTLLESWYKN